MSVQCERTENITFEWPIHLMYFLWQIILEDAPKQPYEGNKEDWEEGQEPVWKKEGNKQRGDVIWDLEKEVCLTLFSACACACERERSVSCPSIWWGTWSDIVLPLFGRQRI